MARRKPIDPERSADLPIHRIRRVLDRLQQRVLVDPVDIPNWEHRRARYVAPGDYRHVDAGWSPIDVGETWGGEDTTCFFRTAVTVPSTHRGDDAVLDIDLDGGEALVRLNGRAWQGLDWNRSVVPLHGLKERAEAITIEIEAFIINYPYDYRRGDERNIHEFRRARIARIDRRLEAYLRDAELAYGAYESFWDDDADGELEELLLHALEQSIARLGPPTLLDRIDFEEIERAHAALRSFTADGHFFRVPGHISVCAHSHLDLVYLWPLKETFRKNCRSVANQLSLMREFPDYKFSWSQPWLYEQLKRDCPELFDEVRMRVAEGRWEPVGAMYIEPDGNLPGSESLIRHILFGQRFFHEAFGVEARTCWLPDVFGVMHTLPQILKKSGIEYFSTVKLNIWNDTNDFPYDSFRWRGPDGSEVIAHFPSTHFGQDYSIANLRRHWKRYRHRYTVPDTMFVYGPADGGGGPTREMVAASTTTESFPGLPDVSIDTVDSFFDRLSARREALPIWDDELYLETHRGTYTSRARLKRENRSLEVLYRNAEVIGSLSRIHGAPSFQDELNVGWKLLLLNQFHDTLTGTHVPAAHDQIDAAYAEAREVGRTILTRSAAWIGERVGGVHGALRSYVVYNSLSWRRSGYIALPLDRLSANELAARGPNGADLPCQEHNGALWIRLDEVPSVGWSTVSLHHSERDGGDDAWMHMEGCTIRTPHYLLEWDEGGAVSRLFDREARRDVVAGRANAFQVLDDDPGEKFSAWDIAYHIDEHPIPVELERPWKRVSSGPLFVVVEASWTVLDSRIEQRMWLYRHERHIEFETKVTWKNDRKLLKVAFPTTMRSRRAETHAPFGAVERATHRNTSWERAKYEVPMHYWVDLSEPRYGVALLNDGSYGCDIHDGTIRLSLVRSPVRPDPESDIGEHEFRYALYPHEGDRAQGGVHRRGYEHNVPLIVHERSSAPPGDDALPAHHSSFSVDAPEIVIETIKEAESGEGLIVRAYEATGSAVTASVDADRIPSQFIETDLLERPIEKESGGAAPSLRDSAFGPYEIRSFLMR